MHRTRSVRFVVWLWLAVVSTVVLPWAHELSHAHAHQAGWLGAAHNDDPQTLASQDVWDVDDHDGADSEHQRQHVCQVCAHLCAQHLALANPLPNLLLTKLPATAPASLRSATPGTSTDWWRPRPRAPPIVLSF